MPTRPVLIFSPPTPHLTRCNLACAHGIPLMLPSPRSLVDFLTLKSKVFTGSSSALTFRLPLTLLIALSYFVAMPFCGSPPTDQIKLPLSFSATCCGPSGTCPQALATLSPPCPWMISSNPPAFNVTSTSPLQNLHLPSSLASLIAWMAHRQLKLDMAKTDCPALPPKPSTHGPLSLSANIFLLLLNRPTSLASYLTPRS